MEMVPLVPEPSQYMNTFHIVETRFLRMFGQISWGAKGMRQVTLLKFSDILLLLLKLIPVVF